jgi:hypothetical protein
VCRVVGTLIPLKTACKDSLTVEKRSLCVHKNESAELLEEPRTVRLRFIQDSYTEIYHYQMMQAGLYLIGEMDTLSAILYFYVPMDLNDLKDDPSLAVPSNFNVFNKNNQLILEATHCTLQ